MLKFEYKLFLACLFAVTVLLFLPGPGRTAEKIQGQKQMMIVDDAFQFVPGSWGDYTIRDKKKKESYHFVFSVLKNERVAGKDCAWMEIKIDMKGKPSVLTRVLMEKTAKGPGEALKAIVQIAGFDPFTVPEKYLKEGKEKQVAPTRKYNVVKRLRQRKILFNGRTVTLWEVEAESADQHRVTAWVSNDIPPLGVFKVDIPEFGMYLNDWGTGAKSEIKGTPMNFYLWIAQQIGSAISKGMSEKK